MWWEIPAIITRNYNYNYLHHFKLTGRCPFFWFWLSCKFLHTLLSTVPSYNPSHGGILPVSVLVHSYTLFSPPSRLTTHPMMVSCLCACALLHTLLLLPGPLPVSVFVLCIPTHFSPSPSSHPSHEGTLP